MKLKTIITVILCSLLVILSGCEKTTTTETTTAYNYFPVEYELEDVDGTIKCTNMKYVFCVEKKKGEDFTILNFADVQLSVEDVGTNNGVAQYAYELMDELIEETNPDLITLTGDQGYGEKTSIDAVSSVISKHGIPWAPVFGNHDNDGSTSMTLRDQVNEYNKYDNCLMHYGPANAAISETIQKGGNYIINIVERDDNGGFHIVRTLFMFNSGNQTTEIDYSKPTINNQKYDHLSERQIDFYKWGLECSKKYTKDGEYAKSTIIQHIPITAYAHAIAAAAAGGEYSAYALAYPVNVFNNWRTSDSNNPIYWKDGYKDSFGACGEPICCSANDDGIFEILKELGSTDSMLVGHDHKNCFSINYQGIKLTFALKTGYGCYYSNYMLGGTVMTVTDDGITFSNIYK